MTSFAHLSKMAIILIQIICLLIMSLVYDVCCVFQRLKDTNIHFDEEKIDFADISDAVKFVFFRKNIRTRNDLDEWCGCRNRERLYDEVQKYTRISWVITENPKLVVRRVYESMLPGYTNARV